MTDGSSRPSSLRNDFTLALALVTGLSLLVAGALVLLTSWLHRTTASAASSAEAVRQTVEAEVDLLLLGRANDPLVTRELESSLRERLAASRDLFAGMEQEPLVALAEQRLADYVGATAPVERGARQAALYETLEALVDFSEARARGAREEAQRVDRLANAIGFGASGALLAFALASVLWLKRRAFEPMLALAATMERYGRGDRAARAAPMGPAELQLMSRRFNEMAGALADQRQAQHAFLGGVAHDLKNPLAALQLSLLAVRVGEPLPPEPRLRQMLDRVRRQLMRMRRMVDDLLDLAAIEAGRLEIRTEALDGRALITEVVELLDGTVDRRFRVEVPDGPVPLACDGLRVEQVIANLISNAVKYSPSDSEISVGIARTDGRVVLWVEDQGIGISEADRQRIFEPFRRVGRAEELAPGVGLGLFVAQRIVAAHHGHIEVDGGAQAGTRFRVVLPSGLPKEEERAERRWWPS